MSQLPNSRNRTFTAIFGVVLGITIALLVLRGFGLEPFTSIPGGIYMFLIILSIGTVILLRLQKTWWRF